MKLKDIGLGKARVPDASLAPPLLECILTVFWNPQKGIRNFLSGGSTGHFNHSLWREKLDDQADEANVLYDPSREDNFSDIGKFL